MKIKRYLLLLLVALMTVNIGVGTTSRDDDDKSKPQDIRRLHPERERARAQKQLIDEMSRKAEQKADPWDTADEVWGTVDMPRAVKDSAAVEGHRLPSSPADGEGRMTWRDEPIVTPIDQLLPGVTVDDGEYRSKYVSVDSLSNEVYFAFTIPEGDSVPGPLRLCLHYSGDMAIDYDQVIFTIEEYNYLFYPVVTRHGITATGQYWMVSDDELQYPHRDLVYALSHGRWGMIKFLGTHGASRVKVLNDGQLNDFANTLSLYLLLGGEM